jgi:hypothetical protein
VQIVNYSQGLEYYNVPYIKEDGIEEFFKWLNLLKCGKQD